MKAASAATLAILAGGEYYKVELYQFALANGTSYYFTAGEVPITVGGHTYQTGLTITRGQFTQKVGIEVQSVDLTIQPQADNPAGAVTVNGYGFLAACRAGIFDGCIVTVSKGFFNLPAAGANLDTSPGVVIWFVGIVDEVQAGRFSVDMTINDLTQLLNLQMPRNILSAGCVHTLFDAGCTLSKSANTYSYTVAGTPTFNQMNSNATKANDFFDRGIITFTSGVLNGNSYVVAQSLNASGSFQSLIPWGVNGIAPSAGDTFNVVPGCDKSQATCSSGKFIIGGVGASNLSHYRGCPYIPAPQTLYDGGTTSTAAPTVGAQGGQGAGSSFSGNLGAGTYAP